MVYTMIIKIDNIRDQLGEIMLDIKLIIENPNLIKERLLKKG